MGHWVKLGIEGGGDRIAQWLAYVVPDPAALGSTTSITKIILDQKLSMLIKLINDAVCRKVYICLKMMIKPI